MLDNVKKNNCFKFEIVTISLTFVLFSCSVLKKTKKQIFESEDRSAKKEEKVVRKATISGPTKKGVNNLFLDKTEEYGLKGVKATHIYAVDFDFDKWTDLVLLPEHYSTPQFYRFNPERRKFEKLHYNPLGENLKAAYLYFADFNKDGLLDLLLGSINQRTEITQYPLRVFKAYKRNSRLRYAEIKKALPGNIWGAASIAVYDFDLDGQLDIYQGNWFDFSRRKPRPKGDKLFKGKGFYFKDVSHILTNEYIKKKKEVLEKDIRPTFGVATCDVDQNGFPDILTSSSSGFANKMWLNLYKKGKGRYYKDYGVVSGFAADEEGKLNPMGGGNSFFSSCSDYNNDGIMDVIVGELSHSYNPESRDRSSFLTGSTFSFPPKFIRTEYYSGEGSQNAWRGTWFDYDIDGLIDVFIEDSGYPPHSRLILYHQERDHAYEDVAEEAGINVLNPSGAVTLDLNKDGLMDIITGQTNIRDGSIKPRLYVFENRIKRGEKKSIRFYLQGRKANKYGLGAMIIVKTDSSVMRQWVEYVHGPLGSQNEMGILFGLNHNQKLDVVDVRWPILSRDRLKRENPILRTYDLSKLTFDGHISVTLCESGKFFIGRQSCW